MLAAVATALVAASLALPSAAQEPLSVVVSIPPQREVVETIGGDRVAVDVLIPPGRSPTTFEVTPRQLVTVAESSLLIPVGVPFEADVVAKIESVMPSLPICTSAIPEDRIQRESTEEPHVHKRDSDHLGHRHESGPDPHFWLDPTRVATHATAVTRCLCAASPADCDQFKKRLDTYRDRLQAVDLAISERLAPLAGRTLLVFHPAYGYFAQRYGLRQVAIEYDGKEPSARRLADIVDEAQRLATPVIFVQPQIAGGGPKAVARATGAKLVVLDPLAPNLSENLEDIAAAIAENLSNEGGP